VHTTILERKDRKEQQQKIKVYQLLNSLLLILSQLCLTFPLANFGQMQNVEFSRNAHVFLYVKHFQFIDCDSSDTPGI